MRTTILAILGVLVGCAGNHPAVRPEANEYDPELYEACRLDDAFLPRFCVRADSGEWQPVRPPSSLLLQGRKLFQGGLYEPAADTLDAIVRSDGLEDECGRQFARWLRGQALYELGRYREAFMDFAAVVRDGPENPFYGEVTVWFEKLRDRIPAEAITLCLAAHRGPTEAASVSTP